MSSILTNNSAMVALQTLKSINSDLSNTTSMISTGKEVSSAKDNAAVWAISKTMESDVKGFKAISDSLSLGQSTVAVARNAAETVTDLLTDIKSKIVASQEENVDRGKLQTDISALTDQIKSVIGAAQFNGQNLVNGSNPASAGNGNGDAGIDILSSLDRNSAGGVAASSISVGAQNLSVNAGTALAPVGANGALTGGSGTPATADGVTTGAFAANGTAANADTVTIAGFAFVAADSATTAPTGTQALKPSVGGVNPDNVLGMVAGDTIELKIGDVSGSYQVASGDSATNVADGIRAAMEQAGLPAGDFTFVNTAGSLAITNDTINGAIAVEYSVARDAGALAALGDIDVDSEGGPAAALSAIEGMLSSAIDAAASFGSVEGRIETQSDFISKLSDSLRSGIGSMVDANMEEASARLQALQVQQQLGVQSLSIANQAPQSILSLFR